VLSWGEQVGLIGSGDRLLLSSLVEHTDRLGVRMVCRSGEGLMSASALAKTPAEFGLSPGTVRRRARRSIDALASLAGRANSRLRPERTRLLRERDVIVCDSIRECCEGLLKGAPGDRHLHHGSDTFPSCSYTTQPDSTQ
jgi:hypothetical protein